MIDIDKDYLITVNLKSTKIKSDKTLFFYNTDLNICNIFIQLICTDEDKTIPDDLIVEFAVLKPETNEFKPLDATLISKEDLLYQVDLTTDYLDIIGTYECEIRVSGTIDNETKCFTSESFDYVVKPNITAKLNNQIKQDKNLPILEKLIKEVNDIGLGIEMNQVQLKKDDNLVGDNKSIVGAINQLREDVNSGGKVELTDYQKKTDDNLATEEKTIVGAVNEINSKTITLEKDDTSFNGIDDTVHNELNTDNKTIIGGINEVNSQCKDIVKQTITTEERAKLNSLENYDDTGIKASINTKADKVTTENLQTQVNNLVLGAVGDGNNAEVVQARGKFSTLNDRCNSVDNLLSDMQVVSRNVFNIDTVTNGKRIDDSGVVSDNKEYFISDFIELPINTDVYITRSQGKKVNHGAFGFAVYDENKTFIYRYYNEADGIITQGVALSKKAKYLRLVASVGTEDIMIFIDTEDKQYTDIPYVPYGKWINENYLKKYNYVNKEEMLQTISKYNKDEITFEKPLEHITKDGGLMSIFRTIGVVGDSLSSGCMEYKNEDKSSVGIDMYEYSWIQYIGRICGSTAYNFSKGGLTSKTFWTTTANKVVDLRENGAKNKCQCYFIALGVNDIADTTIEVGTSADISNANSETFYGYYSRIIKLIQNIQPRAKIFLVGLPNHDDMVKWGARFKNFRDAIADMINHFDNCYYINLFDNEVAYNTDFKEMYFNGFHENAMGYLRTAWVISSYVDWIIRNNYADFREVAFIGTDYSYYTK